MIPAQKLHLRHSCVHFPTVHSPFHRVLIIWRSAFLNVDKVNFFVRGNTQFLHTVGPRATAINVIVSQLKYNVCVLDRQIWGSAKSETLKKVQMRLERDELSRCYSCGWKALTYQDVYWLTVYLISKSLHFKDITLSIHIDVTPLWEFIIRQLRSALLSRTQSPSYAHLRHPDY